MYSIVKLTPQGHSLHSEFIDYDGYFYFFFIIVTFLVPHMLVGKCRCLKHISQIMNKLTLYPAPLINIFLSSCAKSSCRWISRALYTLNLYQNIIHNIKKWANLWTTNIFKFPRQPLTNHSSFQLASLPFPSTKTCHTQFSEARFLIPCSTCAGLYREL